MQLSKHYFFEESQINEYTILSQGICHKALILEREPFYKETHILGVSHSKWFLYRSGFSYYFSHLPKWFLFYKWGTLMKIYFFYIFFFKILKHFKSNGIDVII